MIEYAKFLSKRMLHKKSNIFILLLSMILILIFLIMNIRNQGLFRDKINEQLQTNVSEIEKYESKLSTSDKNSENYIGYEKTIQDLKRDVKAYKEIQRDIDDENWPSVYAGYSEVLENQIKTNERTAIISGESDETSDVVNYLKKDLTYIDYLKKHNLDYENRDYPVFGLSFTTSISQYMLPIITTICCIYLLTQIFTMDYVKEHDLTILFPISKRKVFLTKIIIGVAFSVFVYLFILLCSFLFASLFTSNTGLTYPILMQDKNTEIWKAVSTLTLCKDWFLQGILFYTNLSLFTYILSLVIKEDVYLLLTVTSVVLGLAYLPNVVGFLNSIAHVLPTTYMDYVNVANESLSARYGNPAVSASTSVCVLSVFIVVQFIVCFLCKGLGKFKLKNINRIHEI